MVAPPVIKNVELSHEKAGHSFIFANVSKASPHLIKLRIISEHSELWNLSFSTKLRNNL